MACAVTQADAGLVVRWSLREGEGEVVCATGTGQESARRITDAFVRMEARALARADRGEPHLLQALAQSLWPSAARGLMATPLEVEGGIWGFLLLMWDDAADMRAQDRRETFRLSAAQVTTTLELAGQRSDLEQRVEALAGRIAQSFFRQAALQGACSGTVDRLGAHDVFGDMTSMAQVVFGATYAALLSPVGDEGRLAVVAAAGRPSEGEDWVTLNGRIVEVALRDQTTVILPVAEGGKGPEVIRLAVPIDEEGKERRSVLVLEAPCDERLEQTQAGWAMLGRLNELRREIAQMCRKVQSLHLDTISALAEATDAIDPYTRGESETVRRIATSLAERVGLSTERLEALQYACLLRDIGMISISREVLHRPGKLTDDEWEWVRQHPVTGANMLEPVTYLHDVVPLVRWHQERYDGTGYPDGLAGETIPLENRILSVAEAFCAITSDRPHRPAASADEAVVEIKSQSGKQFDPLIVEHLAVVVL
jgi:hypothetical protein